MRTFFAMPRFTNLTMNMVMVYKTVCQRLRYMLRINTVIHYDAVSQGLYYMTRMHSVILLRHIDLATQAPKEHIT